MKRLAKDKPPQGPSGSGVGSGEARLRASGADHTRRNQAIPEIAPDVMPDRVVRGLLDDWLIPMIVEEILMGRVVGQHDEDGPH